MSDIEKIQMTRYYSELEDDLRHMHGQEVS